MADNLQFYFLELGRVLGRDWSNDDISRSMSRVRDVSNGVVSLDDQVRREIAHLGAEEAEQQLADILLKYYRLLLQVWPVVTEVHSTPSPAGDGLSDLSDDDLADFSEDEDEDGGDDILSQFKKRRCNDVGSGDDEDEEAEICCICLERLYRGLVATLDCRHEFHGDCIRRWLVGGHNSCPLCKARAIR